MPKIKNIEILYGDVPPKKHCVGKPIAQMVSEQFNDFSDKPCFNIPNYSSESEQSEQVRRIADSSEDIAAEFKRLNDKIDMLEKKLDAETTRAEKTERRNMILSFGFSLLLCFIEIGFTLLVQFLTS